MSPQTDLRLTFRISGYWRDRFRYFLISVLCLDYHNIPDPSDFICFEIICDACRLIPHVAHWLEERFTHFESFFILFLRIDSRSHFMFSRASELFTRNAAVITRFCIIPLSIKYESHSGSADAYVFPLHQPCISFT